MKKLLIAVLAVVGLASCTNTVEFEPVQKQIGLSPITQNRTRAMVDGTDFPEKENFMVWAWYKALDAGTSIADWQDATAAQQLYIDEKPFKPKATTKNATGLWAGVTPYFWPKQGSLLFAGYYPTTAETKTAEDGITYEFDGTKNVMTINGYTPGNYTTTGFVNNGTDANCEEDLMYFKMTAASSDSGTNGAVHINNESNVDVVFEHALSWIKVTLAKAADTPDDATITVESVKFTKVSTTGTGTVADSDKDGEVENIVWDVTDSPVVEEIEVLKNNATELGKKTADATKEPIIIPQAMAGNLVITYTIKSTDNSFFREVKTIPLTGMTDSNKNTLNTWAAGTCYTYNIAIGTSEILIDPIVTDWAKVEIPVEIK